MKVWTKVLFVFAILLVACVPVVVIVLTNNASTFTKQQAYQLMSNVCKDLGYEAEASSNAVIDYNEDTLPDYAMDYVNGMKNFFLFTKNLLEKENSENTYYKMQDTNGYYYVRYNLEKDGVQIDFSWHNNDSTSYRNTFYVKGNIDKNWDVTMLQTDYMINEVKNEDKGTSKFVVLINIKAENGKAYLYDEVYFDLSSKDLYTATEVVAGDCSTLQHKNVNLKTHKQNIYNDSEEKTEINGVISDAIKTTKSMFSAKFVEAKTFEELPITDLYGE